MRSLVLLFASFASLFFAPLATPAATIHVPGDQPTIQAGIDAASPGDTVLVACGTYTWMGEGTGDDAGLIRMKSGICLRSQTGQAECVMIDAQQQGRILYCENVERPASIEGFTITGGLPPGPWPDILGGGMYCCDSSSLTLANCSFIGNSVEGPNAYGGGMYCEDYSPPTLANCTFRGNWANSQGGGMFCHYDSPPTLTNCTFSGNSAGNAGGGMDCHYDSPPMLTNCTFSENSAADLGGGIICSMRCSPTLTNCTFSGNSVGFGGGAIYCYDSSGILTNCTFSGNSGGQWAGGILCYHDASPRVSRCTFFGNSAEDGGGIYCYEASSPTLENTIVAFSTEGEAVCCDETSSATLTCCDVYGNGGGDWVGCIADQYGVNGNIWGDPLFCDDCLYLQDCSPCVDAPCCGQIGAYGIGCPCGGGPTSMVPTTWGLVKSIFEIAGDR